MNPIVQRLILSTARGVRQANFLNELLSSNYRAEKREVDISYGRFPKTYSTIYGRTGLPRSSWNGLKGRLVGSGFVIIETELSVSIEPGINRLN